MLTSLLSGKAQYYYFGSAPTFIFPEYLYNTPEYDIYFLWQATFHVMLFSFCLLFAKKWRVIPEDYLFCIGLFAVISPSFLELGTAPTRHYVTFSSVFLFYISFVAFMQQAKLIQKLIPCIWLLVSFILILFSKTGYIIPIVGFVLYYIFFESKLNNRIFFYLVLAAVIAVIILISPFLSELMFGYKDMAIQGANSFSWLVKIPVLGYFAKLLYALLAPFPWQNAKIFISTIYGGNSLLFLMHMLSSLSGIYFFTRLAVYGKRIVKTYPDVRPIIVFGLFMSLTILAGAIGYHGYLSIFFPFFAPLIVIKRYPLSLWFPVFFVILCETCYVVASI